MSFRIVLLMATVSILAYAPASSPANLARLIDLADLALVGTITSAEVNGVQLRLTVSGERVFRGGLPGVYTIVAMLPSATTRSIQAARASRKGPALPTRALIFAKRSGSEWELLSATNGFVLMLEDLVYELPAQYVVPASHASETMDEAIVTIFQGHLASSGPGSPRALRSRAVLTSFARDRRARPPASVVQFAARSLASPDPDARALGISLLVAQNSLSAPAAIDQAQAVLDRRRVDDVVRYFRDSFTAEDVLAVREVARLLRNARSEEIREACLTILSDSHSRPTLPVLAEMLDNPSPAIRGAAVRGLARFANNVPPGSSHKAPGPWRYRSDETAARGVGDISRLAQPESVQFWRDWWERYKKELIEP